MGEVVDFRHRNCVFTINNPSGEEIDRIRAWTQVTYFTVGREVGPKCGTPHLQGYMEFKQQVLQSTIKSKVSKKIICVERKGTPEQNRKYTQKDGDFEEGGTISEQGHRSDLEAVAEMCKAGRTLLEIADDYPTQIIRYHKGIERLIGLYAVRDGAPEYDLTSCCERLGVSPLTWDAGTSHVVCGPSGIGKTEYAKAHFRNALFVSHMDDLKEFNWLKYDGIVFDDMDFTHLPRTAQIHVTDWCHDRSIHARFFCSLIPRHTRKIFCCNEYPFLEDPAIARRVTLLNLHP